MHPDAAATHHAVFGRPSQGVWSAPGRVNLIGEHTDYNGGLALPIALPHRTVAACSVRDDDVLRVHSVQLGETVTVGLAEVGPGFPVGWAAYVAGVWWALRELGYAVPGLDVVVDGRVPLGAGLSSSAALECAVAAAAADLGGLGLLDDDAGRAVLAAAADRAENEIALAPTGGMDQRASMLCREGHALLLDCRSGQTEHVPFDLAAHGLALLVTDTRAEHALVDGQYAQRRADCESAATILEVEMLREITPEGLSAALEQLPSDRLRSRVRHVVTEIDRVRQTVAALAADDLDEVGRLFVASHESLRDDYEVTCPELDLAVETACAAGALGARMTGGGFGGSTISLVEADRADSVAGAVDSAFERAGMPSPVSFTVLASGGAKRDAGP